MTDRFSVEEVQLDTVLVSTLTVQEADAEDSGSYRWISTYLQIHLHTIMHNVQISTNIYRYLQISTHSCIFRCRVGAVSSSSQVTVEPGEGVTLHPYIQAGDTAEAGAGSGAGVHPGHCWVLLSLVTTCMRPYAVLR